MPTAKATSKPGDSPKVDTATSGDNAKASATAPDNQGGQWFSTSSSKTKDGETVTEKTFGRGDSSSTETQDNTDSSSESTWQWIMGSKKASDKDEDSGYSVSSGKGSTAVAFNNGRRPNYDDSDDEGTKADASTGKCAMAKASTGGKGAMAGIVNGKAMATAG